MFLIYATRDFNARLYSVVREIPTHKILRFPNLITNYSAQDLVQGKKMTKNNRGAKPKRQGCSK